MDLDKKKNKKDTVILERRFVQKGTVVVREGELGRNAFLIQSGQVSIYAGGGDGKARTQLAVLGVGQIFGEMALVFDEPRAATAEAAEPCNLIVITRDTLKQKLELSDPMIRAFVPMLLKRLLQANSALLQRQGSLDDMTAAASIIYENVCNALPPARKQTLQNAVLPKLEAFLAAVREFRENETPG